MIIVTGGAGFIGSAIVHYLKDFTKDIVVIDDLGHDDRWKNLQCHSRVIRQIIPIDKTMDFLESDDNMGKIDFIIHMGAISSTTERDIEKLIRLNIDGTLRLFDFCAKRQIPFIYASSAATYGSGEHGFDDRDDLEFLSKLRPLNPYGWSKAFTDVQIMKRKKRPPFFAGLKFFNVYGPNEYHKEGQHSVALQCFKQIQRQNYVTLFKSYNESFPDGKQKRDFVSVETCGEIILWMMRCYKGGNGDFPISSGIYNIGSGYARTFFDLANSVFTSMGKMCDIQFIDMPEGLRSTYQYFTQAPMDKLRAQGFSSGFLSLEDGIGRYIKKLLSSDPYF